MKESFNYKVDARGMSNSQILDAVLTVRGVNEDFFKNSSNNMINVCELKNIEKAECMLQKHIDCKSKITILADVDCDGIMSCSIIYRYLNKMGCTNINAIINDGKQHGVSEISDFESFDLLIVVDSIDYAKEYQDIVNKHNCDIIVLDHHILPDDLQKYLLNDRLVVVSSANHYPNPDLSGAGVCLKFCIYLDAINFTNYSHSLYDLAACGIVGDMCSMASPENRYIVNAGFNAIYNPMLKKIVGNREFNTTTVAFSVAPLINACVRTGKSRIALEAFLSNEEERVNLVYEAAVDCKDIQKSMIDDSIAYLAKQIDAQQNNPILFLIDEDKNKNILGVIANKIMNDIKKPVFIVRECDDGYLRGSMRALGVENMLELVNETGLATCDGHELAAGFSISKENVDNFIREISKKYVDNSNFEDYDADFLINSDQITEELIQNIKNINRISGNGFEPVTFVAEMDNAIPGFMSGGKHLKVYNNENNIIFVKWNDPSYEAWGGFGKIIGVGTLDVAYYGKKKYRQIIMDKYKFLK